MQIFNSNKLLNFNLTAVLKAYTYWLDFSCKPVFKHLPDNYVADENKSVKWNKQYVEKNNKLYNESIKNLQVEKNKRRENFYKVLLDITKKYNNAININEKSVMKIFEYSKKHCLKSDITSIMEYYIELVNLISEITC